MAEIYLMHRKHGVKIATMEMEAQYDEQNGWVRFDPEDLHDEVIEEVVEEVVEEAVEEVVEASVADLPEPAVEVNVLSEAPRRRGRPRVTKDE
jgi:DNA primase large subunit